MRHTPCHVRLVRALLCCTTFGRFWCTYEKILPVQYSTPPSQLFASKVRDITVRTDYFRHLLANWFRAVILRFGTTHFTTLIYPFRAIISRVGTTTAKYLTYCIEETPWIW